MVSNTPVECTINPENPLNDNITIFSTVICPCIGHFCGNLASVNLSSENLASANLLNVNLASEHLAREHLVSADLVRANLLRQI
jgi:uncharacterized protein YjbI with pentapeptide repeats